MKSADVPETRIALISMPWQDPFSPSIQLGTLSSYVRHHRPHVQVDTHELFLELAGAVDIHLAKLISVSWIGEALFAYLLFPEQAASISTYLERSRKDHPAFETLDYAELIEKLRLALRQRLDRTDWRQYRLIGLSVVFAQTLPSILAAYEIKRRAPSVPIVFGGPGCTNLIGKSLLETFDFIDYVVNGEGEKPLTNLIDALERARPGERVNVPAVVHRQSPADAFGAIDQLDDMRELPRPDFDGYFKTLKLLPDWEQIKGRVRVPMETSRGCWWDRSHVDPMLSCTFCNLNLQWHSYREKPVPQSVQELRELSDRYECPDFTVVDNILRHRGADDFIDAIKELDLGLDLWMEARASVKREQVKRLSEVGGRVIQFGVEALSSSMLKKMVKGTTTLQNLQVMKLCEQYGIKNTANLITEFPGMGEEDILESIENIEFARGFFPMSEAEFSLVYQAPVYKAPEKFGVSNIRNYHMYKLLLPPALYERLFLTEKAFDSAELTRLKPLWRRMRAAIEDWQKHYERMRPMVEGNLLLSMQDGGRYLKIRDFRWETPRFYWMRGVERDVYLECDGVVSVSDLRQRFPSVGAEHLSAMLEQWRERRLAFMENNQVLALAVPWGHVSSHRSVHPQRRPERRAPKVLQVLDTV